MAGAIDQRKTITWLHLSDLHCRSKTRWDSHGLLRALKNDLQGMEREHKLSPDLIFFTGDLVFGAVRDETITTQFDEGHAFLESIRTVFAREVAFENVFLVPGNHDVNRGKATPPLNAWLDSKERTVNDITDLIQSGGTSWSHYMDRLADYRDFLQRHHYAHLLTDPDRLIYGLVREVNGVRIGIAGLNSAWSSSGDAQKGHLWLGGAWQIGQVTSQLDDAQPSFMIALIHHPVNWFGEHEDPDLLRLTERELQFLLHGHEHQGWVSIVDGHTRIAAAACYDRQGSDKSGYNFVRLYLDSGEGEVWLRKYESGGWIPRIIPGKTDDHGRWPLKNLEFLPKIRTTIPEPQPAAPALINLPPREPNRYIKRDNLEKEILSYFGSPQPNGGSPRLITLHASGGMGKTRLARACQERARGMFRDGALFVSLDGKGQSAGAVAEAIGSTLGMTGESALPDRLLAALCDKEMLLILDDYESVASDEVRTYLGEMLSHTHNVSLLVTGRTPVGLSNIEQLIDLDGGMNGEEARKLFTARAQLNKGTDWQPTPREEHDLDRIIANTERIPLAIEFAAAWASKKSLKQIADDIERKQRIGPPPGFVDRDPRHNSLRACLDWSFDLLKEGEKEGFVRLGIFPNTFTAPAVVHICDSRDEHLLDRLQDVALVVRLEDNDCDRYRLHCFTQAYAEEKLKSNDESFRQIRQRFVDYFVHFPQVGVLIDRGAATPAAAEIRAALDWMEAEWRNVCACVERAFEAGNWEAVRKFSDAVVCFCQNRGHLQDGRALYEKLALSPPHTAPDPIGLGSTLNALGVIYQYQKCWPEAEKVLTECLKIRQKPDLDRAKTLNSLGTVHQEEHDWPKARKRHEESLKICRDLGDRREQAMTLSNLGLVYEYLGLPARAERVLYQSLRMWEDVHDDGLEAGTLNNFGQIYQRRGNWALAQVYYERRLSKLRAVGDNVGQARCLNSLGYVHQRQASATLAVGDIIDLRGFAAKLKEASEPGLSQYLRGQLSAATQDLLSNYAGGADLHVQEALVEDLNRIIESGPIYEARRFGGVKLSPETQRMLAESPRGAALVLLSRLLLEDAYPVEISKNRCREQWAKAEDCYQEALEICERVGDRAEEGQTRRNVAGLQAVRKDFGGREARRSAGRTSTNPIAPSRRRSARKRGRRRNR